MNDVALKGGLTAPVM